MKRLIFGLIAASALMLSACALIEAPPPERPAVEGRNHAATGGKPVAPSSDR